MKQTVKKILLSLSVVLLFTVLLCFNASALSKTGNCGPKTDSGKYSSSVKWSYNKSKKTLTIRGKGEMGNFYYDNLPFSDANIKTIVVKEGVTSIGGCVFRGCDKVTSVTLPKSLKKIGYDAFNGCVKLKAVKLPSGLKTIESYAFNACHSLSSITIPNNVTVIDVCAFSYCENLKTVKLGKKLKTISAGVFHGCTSLESIIIPDAVTSIGRRAFADCNNLKTVKIGNKVTSIGEEAFYCSPVYSITIPKTVKKFGSDFISDFSVIESTKGSPAIKWAKKNKNPYVETNGTDKASIYSGKIGKYNWSVDKRTGVLKLTGSGKLVDFTNTEAPWKKYDCYIKSISFPSGMTDIGAEAFDGLYRITSVKLPSSVETVGSSAFKDCKSLKTVTLPEKLTTIGSGAFFKCTSLSKINIPDSVSELGESAFVDCDSLTSITIGKNVETIGDQTFIDCENLKTVKLSNGIKNIEGYAFMDCVNLESINLPNSLTEFGWAVFQNCRKLKSITIPYSVSSIPPGIFANCEKLKKVVIYNPECSIDPGCGIGYNTTIYGFKKSTAQTYANEVGASFKDVEKIHTHTEGELKVEKASVYYAENSWYDNCYYEEAGGEDGSKTKRCTVCNKILYTEAVPAVKTIKLDGATECEITYTGAVITPVVTVYDRTGKELTQGTDFTVEYEGERIKSGKYDVTITFKDNYEGIEETTFNIVPENVTNLTLSTTSDDRDNATIIAKWDAVPGADGYLIHVYRNGNFYDDEKVRYTSGYTFTYMECDTTYRIEVKAICYYDNGEIGSKEWAVAEITTPASTWRF